MNEFQAKEVEDFTVDPVTGDITFTRPDGTTYRMVRDPVTGTYRLEQGADDVPSNVDDFFQSALDATLSAVNDQADNIRALESLLSTLGDNAQVEYLKDLQHSYQAYADALSVGADKTMAAAEQWQSIAEGMKRNSGLRDNLRQR